MTQPPNQPPQGGFGAPQDPQHNGASAPPPPPHQPPQAPSGPPPAPGAPPPAGQPGYGYPQQPPAQPAGFGAPQPPTRPAFSPPQQPAANNPYAQQPGPYGQQPGPYGQQQYGYPTQPQYPGAPGGPGGGRNPFKGKPAMIIGAAVALLLVAGGVVYAVTQGGDDDDEPTAHGSSSPSASAPANPGDGSGDGKQDNDPEDLNANRQPGEAKVLWYKSAPDAPGKGADADGMWITDKVAVKAAYKQLFGYNVADGNPAWDAITFPQPICSTSQQASDDGKIVVAYKEGTKDTAKCNKLVEVDLDTGKKGWTTTIEESGLFDSALNLELSISQGTLVVGRSQSGTGLRMSDGKKLWTKKEEKDGVCFPGGFTGGSRIILALSCSAGKDTAHDRVEELDPKTGKTRWTKNIAKGWELERVYSTDPVVLYFTNEDEKKWNISTLKKDSGKTRSQVQVNENFKPECPWAVLQLDLRGCFGTVADAHTLYLPTEAKSGANEIVAIDLETGKESWRVKAPGDTSMLPLRTEGGNVIAYQKPSYDAGGAVLSIPTSGDHKPKKLLQNPASTAKIENGFYSSEIAYTAGRFYISTTQLTGSDKTQEKLMMAFGK